MLRGALPSPAEIECPIPAILAAVDDDDRLLLVRALQPKVMDSGALKRTLAAAGHPIAEQRIRDHKRGTCSCQSSPTS